MLQTLMDADNYANMLLQLMDSIQRYLMLSDHEKRGALSSLQLVDSTALQPDENRICIWLQEWQEWPEQPKGRKAPSFQ